MVGAPVAVVGAAVGAPVVGTDVAGLVGARGSKAPSWPGLVFARLAWLGTLGLVASLHALTGVTRTLDELLCDNYEERCD